MTRIARWLMVVALLCSCGAMLLSSDVAGAVGSLTGSCEAGLTGTWAAGPTETLSCTGLSGSASFFGAFVTVTISGSPEEVLVGMTGAVAGTWSCSATFAGGNSSIGQEIAGATCSGALANTSMITDYTASGGSDWQLGFTATALTASDGAGFGRSYTQAEDPGVTVTDGSGPAPCTFGTVYGYSSGVTGDGSTPHTFNVNYSGSVTQVIAVDDNWNAPVVGGAFETIDGQGFYTNAVVAQAVPATFGLDLGPLSLHTVFGSGEAVDPDLWCDYNGTWTDWGLASTLAGGTPLTPNEAACTLNGVGGDTEGNTSDGTSIYWMIYDFSYGSKLVLVDEDEVGSGPTETIDGHSFWTDSVLQKDDSPTSPAYEAITPDSGDVVNPDAWCDENGTWTDWGLADSAALISNLPGSTPSPVTTVPVSSDECSGDGGAFCFSTCFSSTGMDLYNPLSWVTGAVKFMICGVRWVVQPSQSKINTLENEFGVSSNAPVTGPTPASEWLGSMAKGAAAFPYTEVSDIQTVADGGGCSGILADGDTLDGHSTSACTILTSLSSLPSDATSNIAWLQVVLSAIIYLFGALLLYFEIRKVISK